MRKYIAIVLSVSLTSPAWSAISLVQKATEATPNGVTAASNALGSTPTSGNLLIGIIGSNDGSATNPTGYTTAVNCYNTTDDDFVRIVYKVAGASEATSITFTGLAGNSHTVGFMEYTGNTASPLDVTASAAESLAATSTTSGTTAVSSQNAQLSIAAWRVRADVSGISYTNSFVQQYDTLNPANGETMIADKIESSASAKESTVSWSSGSGDAWGCIAVFNAAAAGATAGRSCIMGSSLLGCTNN